MRLVSALLPLAWTVPVLWLCRRCLWCRNLAVWWRKVRWLSYVSRRPDFAKSANERFIFSSSTICSSSPKRKGIFFAVLRLSFCSDYHQKRRNLSSPCFFVFPVTNAVIKSDALCFEWTGFRCRPWIQGWPWNGLDFENRKSSGCVWKWNEFF